MSLINLPVEEQWLDHVTYILPDAVYTGRFRIVVGVSVTVSLTCNGDVLAKKQCTTGTVDLWIGSPFRARPSKYTPVILLVEGDLEGTLPIVRAYIDPGEKVSKHSDFVLQSDDMCTECFWMTSSSSCVLVRRVETDPVEKISKEDEKVVHISYTNFRGETGERDILPLSIQYMSTMYHPTSQWIMRVHDLEKGYREIAIKDIHSWKSISQ